LKVYFLKFLISGIENKTNVIAIKKSSNRIETYVPGILKSGNLGYSGTEINIAVIKYLYKELDIFKNFCINLGYIWL